MAMARFQYGCSGANLDILVREPLWEHGLDFNHGTGHGVGYLLNVHEGPQNINWKIRSGGRRGNTTPLEEGMLTSDDRDCIWKENTASVDRKSPAVQKSREKFLRTVYGI